MKTWKRGILSVLITALFLLGSLAIINNTTADTEPNNSQNTAELTTTFSNLAGEINSTAGDYADWYSVNFTGGQLGDKMELPVDITNKNGTAAVLVYMPTDNGRNFLIADLQIITNGRYWINFTAQVTGEHFIVFQGHQFEYDASLPNLTATQYNGLYRNNNTFANAHTLHYGTYNGTGEMINGLNSVDVMNFTTGPGDRVDINFQMDPSYDFYLFNATMNDTTSINVQAHITGKRVFFTATQKDTYYMVINGPIRLFSTDVAYNFTTSILPKEPPKIWSPAISPQAIPHNQDSMVTFSVNANDIWGDVTNVTVDCVDLWSGKRQLKETAAEQWQGAFEIPKMNLTGKGNCTVNFTAVDNELETNTTTAVLSVVFGNRAPISDYSLTNPIIFEIDEDSPNTPLDLDHFVTDPDTDIINYFIEGGKDLGKGYDGSLISLKIDYRSILTIDCIEDMVGTETVTLNATDGIEILRFNVSIKILPVNDLPLPPEVIPKIVDAIPLTPGVKENLTVTLNITQPVDPDNEPYFNYSIDFDGDGKWDETLQKSEAKFEVPHTYFAAGDYTVKVMATDTGGESASTTLNITVLEPYLQPEWWTEGWMPEQKVALVDDTINITWQTCEVHKNKDDNTTVRQKMIDYLFSGTCTEDVDVIYIYVGEQFEEEDFLYFPTMNQELNGSYFKFFMITPEDGKWSASWTDFTEYDPLAAEPEETPFLKFAAVGWRRGKVGIGETEADYYLDGNKNERPKDDDPLYNSVWKLGGFTSDELDKDPTVEITFDICKVVRTEYRDTPSAGTLTYEMAIEFSGTCGEDVRLIQIYERAGMEFFPYAHPETGLYLEITPFAGTWSFKSALVYEVDQQTYDLLKAAMEGLDIEYYEMIFLSLAWTQDNRTNYVEVTAQQEELGDGGDGGFWNSPLGWLVIGAIAVLILIIIIVVIVLLVKRSSKKGERLKQLDEQIAQHREEQESRERKSDRRRPQRDTYDDDNYGEYLPPEQEQASPEDYNGSQYDDQPVEDFGVETAQQAQPWQEEVVDYEEPYQEEPEDEEDWEPDGPVGPIGPGKKKDIYGDFPDDDIDDDDDDDDWDDDDHDEEEDGFLDIDDI